ncbi:MAG TPA: cytochrome P450 [Candidatus Obscuribacterales bacterium]
MPDIDSSGTLTVNERNAASPLRANSAEQLQFFLECRRRYGDYVKFRAAGEELHLFAHPDAVEHILLSNQDHYSRPESFTARMSPLMGGGLLTSSGDLWLRQRRLLQPLFGKRSVADVHQVVADRTGRLLELWQRAGGDQIVDFYAEMERLANSIAVELLFGGDKDETACAARTSLVESLTLLKQLMHRALFAADPTAVAVDLATARQRFEKLVTELMSRRDTGLPCHDLLALMSTAGRDQPGGTMTRQQLFDEAKTFLVAGHHATATAVTWTWFLLCQHKGIRNRFYEQLGCLRGNSPDPAKLAALPYLRMILEESLRLYPPVFVLARTARHKDTICGRTVPAGATVLVSQWVTHRHPEFWARPEEFDPERFNPAEAASRHRFAFFPFGAGQRQCIGQQPAIVEALTILTMVGQAFDLELYPDQEVVPYPSFVLMPRDGLRMRLRRRKG